MVKMASSEERLATRSREKDGKEGESLAWDDKEEVIPVMEDDESA